LVVCLFVWKGVVHCIALQFCDVTLRCIEVRCFSLRCV
jgi:hypothetical protein